MFISNWVDNKHFSYVTYNKMSEECTSGTIYNDVDYLINNPIVMFSDIFDRLDFTSYLSRLRSRQMATFIAKFCLSYGYTPADVRNIYELDAKMKSLPRSPNFNRNYKYFTKLYYRVKAKLN